MAVVYIDNCAASVNRDSGLLGNLLTGTQFDEENFHYTMYFIA